MSLKILGGDLKGREIKISKKSSLRPTSIMLRRKFFDSHQDWEGKVFVDLCAGSGAMGFEALSRGASKIIFVEKDKRAFSEIKANAKVLAEKETAKTLNMSFKKWLGLFEAECKENDGTEYHLFFDPPYAQKELYTQFFNWLKESASWFSGTVWIESDRLKGVKIEELSKWGLNLGKTFLHSDSYLVEVSL